MLAVLKWVVLGFIAVIFLLQAELYLAAFHPCYLVVGMCAAPFLLLFLPRFSGGYFSWLIIVLLFGFLFLGIAYQGVGGIFMRCLGELSADSKKWVERVGCRLPAIKYLCTARDITLEEARQDQRPYTECRVRAALKHNPKVCQAIAAGCGTPDWNPGSPWLGCVEAQTPFAEPNELLSCYAEEMGTGISRIPAQLAAGAKRLLCVTMRDVHSMLPDSNKDPATTHKLARCAAAPGLAACGG